MDLCGSETELVIKGYLFQDLNNLKQNSLIDIQENIHKEKSLINFSLRIPPIIYSFLMHSRSNSYAKFLVKFFFYNNILFHFFSKAFKFFFQNLQKIVTKI